MLLTHFVLGILATLPLFSCPAQELIISDDNPLAMPMVGAHQLRILSPTLLELTLITTKKPDPATVTVWNFVGSDGKPRLPDAKEISVQVDGKSDAVSSVGFKRRVLYAPLKQRDLRIGNYLYLQLATPVAETNPSLLSIPTRNSGPPKHILLPKWIRCAGVQPFTSTRSVICPRNPRKQWLVSMRAASVK